MLVASVEDLFVALPLREFEGLRLLRLALEILHRVDSNRPPAHLLIATYKEVAFSFGTDAMACSSALATVHRHIDGDGMACILD